jgi:hypothetical protein
MGADLITYICVGPKRIKLSETRRQLLKRAQVMGLLAALGIE